MPFEVWKDPTGKVRFCFSHSDEKFTTGVLMLEPNTSLPKHNRPLAFENLLQIQGSCTMTLLDEAGGQQVAHQLEPGDFLRMDKGQWHIHANPSDQESVTLFKAEGDITAVMETLRQTFEPVPLKGKE